MISIIVCSIDAAKFATVTRNLAARMGDAGTEVIGIHDARSLAEGYNRGLAQSRGDLVVLCHDDVELVTPDFRPRLVRHLATHELVGCAGTTRVVDSNWTQAGDPHVHGVVAYPVGDAWPAERFDLVVWGGFDAAVVEGAQALDGFFLAAQRRVVESLRFDERTFDGFHACDTDFTYAAHLAGFRVAVCKDLLVAHRSHGDFGGEYAAWGARFMQKYAGRLAPGATGSRKTAVARNLDRAQMLDLCARTIGRGD